MTHRESLAGNLKRPTTQITWTAKSSLHLSGFVHHAAQIVVLTAQFGHLIFQRGICWGYFGSGGAEFYAAGRTGGERPSPVLASSLAATSYLQSGFQTSLLHKSVISRQTCNQCHARSG